jgi:hypothetical protein
MNDDLDPPEEVRMLTAELLARMALNADGQPVYDGAPENWAEIDATPDEIVRRGPVRFKIIDSDAVDLAIATGAVDEDSLPTLCLRVRFEVAEGAPEPVMGQFVVLPTDEPGVSIVFRVCVTHADLHDPDAPDLGPGAVRNEAFDALAKDQALLVQVLDNDEELRA